MKMNTTKQCEPIKKANIHTMNVCKICGRVFKENVEKEYPICEVKMNLGEILKN